jgi:hypothetical protein
MKMATPLFLSVLLFTACHKKDVPAPISTQAVFDTIPTAKPLTSLLKEASGIASSKNVANTLWVAEDSGNPPQLYSLNNDGTVRKTVYLKEVTNRDWEDLARAGDTLYVADIGDNNKVFSEYAIYKFAEPTAIIDTVLQVDKIRFRYPDGAHDAESLLVDPATKDIFIITKQDDPSAIYKISFPYSITDVNTAVRVGQLGFTGAVGAALSPDASEVLVKSYITMYYYKRNNLSLEAALQTPPTILPYKVEPQGEAITFAANNSGFFTLSEKGLSNAVNLYFYKRR